MGNPRRSLYSGLSRQEHRRSGHEGSWYVVQRTGKGYGGDAQETAPIPNLRRQSLHCSRASGPLRNPRTSQYPSLRPCSYCWNSQVQRRSSNKQRNLAVPDRISEEDEHTAYSCGGSHSRHGNHESEEAPFRLEGFINKFSSNSKRVIIE